MDKKEKITLREKLEQNIYKVLLTVMFVTGSTVYGIMTYFEGVKISNAVFDCNSKLKEYANILSSLNRGVTDNNFFDIKNFIISKSKNNFAISNSYYFEKERFFSQKSNDVWNFSCDTNNNKFGYELFNNYKWVYKESTSNDISTNDNINEFLKANITLEIYSEEVLAKIYDDVMNNLISLAPDISIKDEILRKQDAKDIHDYLQVTKDYYLSDLITRQALGIINSELNIFIIKNRNKGKIRVNKIQKVENIIYCQTLSENQISEKEETRCKVIFLKTEYIFITENRRLYLLIIKTPSLEPIPNDDVENDVLSWLSKFKIVID